MMRLTALILVASLMTARDCNDPLWSMSQKADAGPLYRSTFPKPSPKCCLIDRLPGGRKQLEEGQSNTGESASADPVSGLLKLRAPDTFQTDPVLGDKTVSVGLFRTGLSYGAGTVMTARATFRKPEGPLDDLAWSVGVTARDGDSEDLFNAARVSATLKIRKGHAYLNIGGGADPTNRDPQKDIGAVYGSIFNGDKSQPFTLELHLDRTPDADSVVSLIKDGQVREHLRFRLDPAIKDKVFTTVGATLADCCVAKAKLSAELKEFEVLASDRSPDRD